LLPVLCVSRPDLGELQVHEDWCRLLIGGAHLLTNLTQNWTKCTHSCWFYRDGAAPCPSALGWVGLSGCSSKREAGPSQFRVLLTTELAQGVSEWSSGETTGAMLIQQPRASRGMSLVLVLMSLSLAGILCFGMASISTVQLRTSTAAENQEHARNLAESAVYLSIAKLNAGEDLGTTVKSVEVPLRDFPAGSLGAVSFDPTLSRRLGCHTSFSNFSSKTAQPSPDGISVPGETILLIGYGQCGQSKTQIECLFYRPAFPTSLSSEGPVQAEGLKLSSLVSGVQYKGPESLTPEHLRPADMHSNSTSDHAVVLTRNCFVSGDVSAVGKVDVLDGSQVAGETRRGAVEKIPTLDLAGIRNRLRANDAIPRQIGSVLPSLTDLNWYVEPLGSLSIQGDLSLDGGLLYVPGDLEVSGEITGRGAIVASGGIKLGKGTRLEGRDLVVVACGKDLTLKGSNSGEQFFQGLLYCGGNLNVSNLTVVGSVVSHGNTDLKNVNLIQTPLSVTAAFGAPVRTGNNDDMFFWHIDPVYDPVTKTTKFDYRMDIFYYAFQSVNTGSPHAQSFGKNLTEDEVMQRMLLDADQDFQAQDDVSSAKPILGSIVLRPLIKNYFDSLKKHGSYAVTFDLNRVLSPSQNSRILLWRRLEN
jgi:hypothetical protein